ncbi:MAG: c-type cytochrome [Gammaproteobacteria bacterium]|nr:c-type cytochrome [Gammaproteobacteria bacterium]
MLTRKPILTVMVSLLMLMLMAGNIQAKGNIARGGDLTFDCIECHGMDGKGDFETPPIAGLKESYLLKQLRGFYSGKIKSQDDMMHLYTEDRTDQDLQDLAAYWASLKK